MTYPNQTAQRIIHDENYVMTRSEKFVKQQFPDARCVMVDNTYRGITTRWYVIFIYSGTKIEELGASRKNEIVAWRNARYWTKHRIHTAFLEKLEA